MLKAIKLSAEESQKSIKKAQIMLGDKEVPRENFTWGHQYVSRGDRDLRLKGHIQYALGHEAITEGQAVYISRLFDEYQ